MIEVTAEQAAQQIQEEDAIETTESSSFTEEQAIAYLEAYLKVEWGSNGY